MTEPIYADTIPAYAHGGQTRDPSPFIKIHSTEGPMSDGNARALANWFARSPAAGGPGTSATDIFDPVEAIQMLDHRIIPYDSGPKGNPRGSGSEHCGSVNLTKAQWLTDRAKDMLDMSARANAQEAHRRGWTLAQCRWLTVSEVARFVAGFCTHNDIRLALGGTTHSDPGPNFPYAWYMERVRFWFQNPSGQQEDELEMATKQEFQTWMNECLEHKLGLAPGEDMALALYGQKSNKQFMNRVTATNNPVSVASMVSGLVKSVSDLTVLVASIKSDTTQLTDDEQNIVNNATALAADLETLLKNEATADPLSVPSLQE